MRAFCESSCHKSFCSQYQKASINTFLWMWCLFVWKGKIGKKRWTHHHDSPHGWVAINKMWIIYGRVSIKKNWNIIRFYFSFVPSWQPNRLLSIFPPPNISDWNVCFSWAVVSEIHHIALPGKLQFSYIRLLHPDQSSTILGVRFIVATAKKQAFLNCYNNVVAKWAKYKINNCYGTLSIL